ncbi:MAG TPA: ribonuclease G [Gammaproteobacteria bacterium]|jgi:ribonuclease G|nr:ribonuclease G [Gammaproteobacteria bacterium]
MAEELLINVTPQETRVAYVENGMLTEVLIERAKKRGLVGNIYVGKVVRVLPGMEAAFVDVGLERAAFLHAADLARTSTPEASAEERNGNRSIHESLAEGQLVVVQVIKDPLGSKGARLTTNLTIPSRYLVLMPNEGNIGVSTKIEEEEERERLRTLVQELIHEDDGGFIVRTLAEGVTEEALANDMQFLRKVWQTVTEKLQDKDVGRVVFKDLPLVLRTLRDIKGKHIERIRIDSRETSQLAHEFCDEYVPELSDKIEHYPGERPIFDIYGVEDEIQKALDKKVQLKSGGYLVIDQTESMTTIDVNTGGFVGNRNLEETIFKTNLEAAQAIVRQLRLRNLGGIIIIDFIDMTTQEHRQQVMRAFDKYLQRDPVRTQVCEVSSLGLVEMTRKRTRESLEHVLTSDCPACSGRGTMKTAETVCYEITREIIRQVRQFGVSSLTVVASTEVTDLLLDEQSGDVAELEEFIGVPIRLQGESMYTREQYDVVLV